MGFGEAFINIILLTQWIINSPIIYNRKLSRLEANPRLKHKFKMWRWYLCNVFILTVLLFSVVHLVQLLKRYDPTEPATVGKAYKEEIMVYVFTVAITTQAVVTWETVSRDPGWYAYVESQIMRTYNVRYRGKYPFSQK